MYPHHHRRTWSRCFNGVLSFRNRSCCNGIRTGVEEDSSDGSRVGGSCWGYRSTGRDGPSSSGFAIRYCTGVASLVFGGTSGRQRRCILRLLRLIISRIFLPREIVSCSTTSTLNNKAILFVRGLGVICSMAHVHQEQDWDVYNSEQ